MFRQFLGGAVVGLIVLMAMAADLPERQPGKPTGSQKYVGTVDAVGQWKVEADPLPEALRFTLDHDLAVPLAPYGASTVFTSATPSPFVGFGAYGNPNKPSEFKVVDVRTGRITGQFKHLIKGHPTTLVLSPDGESMALMLTPFGAGPPHTLMIASFKTGRPIADIPMPKDRNHNDVKLAYVGDDRVGVFYESMKSGTGGEAHVYQFPSGKLLWSATGRQTYGDTLIIAVSPGLRYLALARKEGGDFFVDLHDTKDGSVAGTLKTNNPYPAKYTVKGMAFSSDGKQLIGMVDGLRLWSLDTGKRVGQSFPTSFLGALAVYPNIEWVGDGPMVVQTNRVLIDLRDGAELVKLPAIEDASFFRARVLGDRHLLHLVTEGDRINPNDTLKAMPIAELLAAPPEQ